MAVASCMSVSYIDQKTNRIKDHLMYSIERNKLSAIQNEYEFIL
jgi:hypothetical protein